MSLNIDSPLGKILTKLLDLVVLQVLFVVTSIPVVTIGAGFSAMFAVCRKLRQCSVYTRRALRATASFIR